MVANSIEGSLREALVLPLPELVVSLSNLPNMSINGDSFTPSKTHQANTVSDFRTDTLKLKQFLVSSAIAFSTTFWQRLLVWPVITRLFVA